MSTKTKKKSEQEKKPRIRTEPWKVAHRKMIELTLTDSVMDMMLKQIVMLEKSRLRAKHDMQDYLMENVVEAVINAANEKMDPELRQDSLVLHSTDGTWKFSINQQIKRWFDDRASQAIAYIQDFINEHQEVSPNPDMELMIEWLKGLFFGASRKKKLKFTPQLHDFMTKDPDELHDDRLKKAQQILKDSYHTKRTSWYYTVEKFVESENEYVSLEDLMYPTEVDEEDSE